MIEVLDEHFLYPYKMRGSNWWNFRSRLIFFMKKVWLVQNFEECKNFNLKLCTIIFLYVQFRFSVSRPICFWVFSIIGFSSNSVSSWGYENIDFWLVSLWGIVSQIVSCMCMRSIWVTKLKLQPKIIPTLREICLSNFKVCILNLWQSRCYVKINTNLLKIGEKYQKVIWSIENQCTYF